MKQEEEEATDVIIIVWFIFQKLQTLARANWDLKF